MDSRVIASNWDHLRLSEEQVTVSSLLKKRSSHAEQVIGVEATRSEPCVRHMAERSYSRRRTVRSSTNHAIDEQGEASLCPVFVWLAVIRMFLRRLWRDSATFPTHGPD